MKNRPHKKRERIIIQGQPAIRLTELEATRLMVREVHRQTRELDYLDIQALPAGAAVTVFGHRMETALNNISAILRREATQAPSGRLQLMITGADATDVIRITGAEYGEFGGIFEFSGHSWHDLTLQQGQHEVQMLVCEEPILRAEDLASMIDVPQERLIGLLDREGLLSWIVSRRSSSWLTSEVMITTTPARVLNHHEDGEFVNEELLSLARELELQSPDATIIIHEGLIYTQASWNERQEQMEQKRQQHEQEQEEARIAQAQAGSWRYAYFGMTPEERSVPRSRRARGSFVKEHPSEVRKAEKAKEIRELEMELADLTLDLPDETPQGSNDEEISLFSL